MGWQLKLVAKATAVDPPLPETYEDDPNKTKHKMRFLTLLPITICNAMINSKKATGSGFHRRLFTQKPDVLPIRPATQGGFVFTVNMTCQMQALRSASFLFKSHLHKGSNGQATKTLESVFQNYA